MSDFSHEIVRTEQFEKDLALLHECDYPRADEFISGAEWILAANPEAGTKVNENPDIWFLPYEGQGAVVALYYTFDDEKVYLLGIEPTEALGGE